MPLLVIALLGCGGKNTEPAKSTERTTTERPSPEPAPLEEVVMNSGSRAAPRSVWAPAATDFALAFHRGAKPGNNAVSGVGAYLALSMLAEGSKGITREAFAQALGGSIDKDFHIDNERARVALNHTAGVKLSSANALWVDQGIELEPTFIEALGSSYGAIPSEQPFTGDTSAAVAAINQWSHDQTRGLIPKLFSERQLEGAVFVLANAVAFEGNWAEPFDRDLTTDAAFSAPKGEVMVPTLHAQNEKFGHLDGEGFTAVVLPYEGSMCSMVLMLPDEGTSLEDLERRLTASNLKEAALVRGRRPMNLSVPRFKIEVEHDLKTALDEAGLGDALRGGDYTGIAPQVVLGAAIQKVFVEVDEKGTKAAAVTGVVGTRSLPPPPIDVDFNRPFFFALWHKETGVPLFTGRVVDPS